MIETIGFGALDNMILYHGGLETIKYPSDDRTTALSTDFGDGFYLTKFPNQAERWALSKYRKAVKRGWRDAIPTVNVYELDREKVLREFKTKYFSDESDEWLDFIIQNRSGNTEHIYDYVEGPMADDRVYDFVAAVIQGEITRSEFWEKASFKYETHQAMIRHDAIYCLDFVDSYGVEVGRDE